MQPFQYCFDYCFFTFLFFSIGCKTYAVATLREDDSKLYSYETYFYNLTLDFYQSLADICLHKLYVINVFYQNLEEYFLHKLSLLDASRKRNYSILSMPIDLTCFSWRWFIQQHVIYFQASC